MYLNSGLRSCARKVSTCLGYQRKEATYPKILLLVVGQDNLPLAKSLGLLLVLPHERTCVQNTRRRGETEEAQANRVPFAVLGRVGRQKRVGGDDTANVSEP